MNLKDILSYPIFHDQFSVGDARPSIVDLAKKVASKSGKKLNALTLQDLLNHPLVKSPGHDDDEKIKSVMKRYNIK